MTRPDLAAIHRFDVAATLPSELEPLAALAQNLWWSWHPEAIALFIRVDNDLWRSSKHNPVQMLARVSQDRLDELAKDAAFLSDLQAVHNKLQATLAQDGWFSQAHGKDVTIAYFCAEFAITEAFRIYSGGLGVLAGDHLKSASDLGLPLVAVGLLYREGYFQQYLSADGWQQEYRPAQDFDRLPLERVCDADGEQVRVSVRLPRREISIALWRAKVGRISLYLLDTDLQENDNEDRAITGQLYGGDMDMRIRQELVLGIGGVRALEAIGIRPDVCHMNEGHSAFLALERIRRLIEDHNLSFDEARQAAMASHVFTTHTPVPAGIDRFPQELVRKYLTAYHESLRLDMEGLLALGRDDVYDKNGPFSMATLALRTSDWCNGVSALHGKVSRTMWQRIWPGLPEDEVPIGHVTNGVHADTWLAPQIAQAIDDQLDADARTSQPAEHSLYRAATDIDSKALWEIHQDRRERLVAFTKRDDALRPEHIGPPRRGDNDLDPNALTIGFARRFATYKRGNLFLRDAERLIRLLQDTDRPIQFVIAGKAHPADGGGKDLIRQIVAFTHAHHIAGKIVFLENYNMHSARYLIQGCDVWLNNPRRGMEASGTSGMKAAMNGVLNCSILDGWWDEAYNDQVGWAIGYPEEYDNPEVADQIESQSLYELLEREIIPMFYDRDDRGVPQQWAAMMKQSIAQLGEHFNTNRMVQQYAEQFYLPSAERAKGLSADNLAGSIARAHQKDRIRSNWARVRFVDTKANLGQPLASGQTLHINAAVELGDLRPDEVRVQAVVGPLDDQGALTAEHVLDLSCQGDGQHGQLQFSIDHPTADCGPFGLALRIVPGGDLLESVTEPGLIYWQGQPIAPMPTSPGVISVG